MQWTMNMVVTDPCAALSIASGNRNPTHTIRHELRGHETTYSYSFPRLVFEQAECYTPTYTVQYVSGPSVPDQWASLASTLVNSLVITGNTINFSDSNWYHGTYVFYLNPRNYNADGNI